MSIRDALDFYRANPTSITGKKGNISCLDGFDAVVDRYWDYKRWGYSELLLGTLECTKQFMATINEYDMKNSYNRVKIHKMKKDFRKIVYDLGIRAGIKNIVIAIVPRIYYKSKQIISY